MEKLVLNGEIYLDGTLPKYAKEKKLCQEYEAIQNIEERTGLKVRIIFKALFDGAFLKDAEGKIHHVDIMGICENCLMIAQFTDTYNDYLFFEDFGKTWALHARDLMVKEAKYKDCYLKLQMTLKTPEIIDDKGRYCYITHSNNVAILHPDQANNPKKVETIKQKMFEAFCQEKNLTINSDKMNNIVKFDELIKVPKKSAPITYNI